MKALYIALASVVVASGVASADQNTIIAPTADDLKAKVAQDADEAMTSESSDPEDVGPFVEITAGTNGVVSNKEFGAAREYVQNACKEVKLSDEQKTHLREAFIDNRKIVVENVAKLRLARLNFLDAATDATPPSQADIDKMISDWSTAVSNISTARAHLKANVFFKLLKPEQRRPALKCMITAKRAVRLALAKRIMRQMIIKK